MSKLKLLLIDNIILYININNYEFIYSIFLYLCKIYNYIFNIIIINI